MSHFYGRLYGSPEKPVVRAGSTKYGIEAKLFSADGNATLRLCRKEDRDWLEVELNGIIIFKRPIASIEGTKEKEEKL